MKKLQSTLIALALGICSASAFTIYHDTDKKFDLSFGWKTTEDWSTYHPYLASAAGNSIWIDFEPHGWFMFVSLAMVSPRMPEQIDGGWAVGSFLDKFIVSWEATPENVAGFFPPIDDPVVSVYRDGFGFNTNGFIPIFGNNDFVKIKVAEDLSSVRYTWKFGEDPIIPVPEGGSTLGMLAFALCGLPLLRRKQ